MSEAGCFEMNLTRRLGIFTLLVGLGMIFLFFISDKAQQPHYNYFFWGLILAVAGAILMRRARPADHDPGRFRSLRKVVGKIKKKEAPKKK